MKGVGKVYDVTRRDWVQRPIDPKALGMPLRIAGWFHHMGAFHGTPYVELEQVIAF